MFARFARSVNRIASSPAATFGSIALVVLWLGFGPVFHWSDSYQIVANTVTSLITFIMVFVLNSAEDRNTTAESAKIDAILLALENVDNALIGLERKPEAEADALKKQLEDRVAAAVAPPQP